MSRIYEQKMSEEGLAILDERRIKGDLIQTCRILNGIDQVEPSTGFTLSADRDRAGAANTRHSRDTTRIVEGVSKIHVRKNFFSQRVARHWNTLPERTIQQKTVRPIIEQYYDSLG